MYAIIEEVTTLGENKIFISSKSWLHKERDRRNNKKTNA